MKGVRTIAYDSYILRIWRNVAPDGPQWRCRVEHLPSKEIRQFNELGDLLAYLKAAAGMQQAQNVQCVVDTARENLTQD